MPDSPPSADIPGLATLLRGIEEAESAFDDWAKAPRDAVGAYRDALHTLNAEAWKRVVRALRTDPAASAALREALKDEIVYAVLRHHHIIKPSIGERIETALASVRPLLATHDGDVDLAWIDPPRIGIRFKGSCESCPASALTIQSAVKTAVQAACPEISDIVHVTDTARTHTPSPSDSASNWLPAGMLDDIPDNGVRYVELAGKALILSRRGEAVSCFENACAHLGSSLSDGIVAGGRLTCSAHGFSYDLATGECVTAPALSLSSLDARNVAGRILIRQAP